MKKLLDVGCGRKTCVRDGYETIGIDLSPKTDARIVCDIDHHKLPFKDNSFDLIICNNVLEHVCNFMSVLNEIYRVAKPSCLIEIRVPHFSGMDAFQDPTHERFFGSRSFNYFITDRYPLMNYYAECKFKLCKYKISFILLIIGES